MPMVHVLDSGGSTVERFPISSAEDAREVALESGEVQLVVDEEVVCTRPAGHHFRVLEG